ncbi:uncharacterized protein LOC120110075 [Phoenix dactylifera]|uniref:Uncharacterized protein LOC120110075 n=1 Tax=Phoenix dactylifera TaxID=42345 RepID=A0A8B9A041_PHODC|nr:uncharacterized protein LOC120110075 [Phoenix dactylifera]
MERVGRPIAGMGNLRTTLGNRLMGSWWTTTFRQDMLHAQLFCINFVIFFSAALLSPYGMTDVLRQSHPYMFGLYISAEVLALLFSVSALVIFVTLPCFSITRVPYVVALLAVLALGSYAVLLFSYGWFLFSAHLGLPLLAYVGGTASSILLLSFCFQLPVRGFIYWLNRERSGMDPTALEVLISKPASTGSVVTVVLYCLSLGLQSVGSFAGLRNMMSPHVIIILTIIWLQCGVPSLTHPHPPQFETVAAPTQMSEP